MSKRGITGPVKAVFGVSQGHHRSTYIYTTGGSVSDCSASAPVTKPMMNGTQSAKSKKEKKKKVSPSLLAASEARVFLGVFLQSITTKEVREMDFGCFHDAR